MQYQALLDLHRSDGLRPEVSDTFSSSVRRELGIHQTGYERNILLGIFHLTTSTLCFPFSARIIYLVQYTGLHFVPPTLLGSVLALKVPGFSIGGEL